MRRGIGTLAWGLLVPAALWAQGRRVLTPDTYHSWEQVQGATLSADGDKRPADQLQRLVP